MRVYSRNGGGRCMPASSRPWKRSPETGWPSRSNGWRTMPCGARSGTRPLPYCRQAGARAVARSAYREAVAYFEQALRVLPHLPRKRSTLEQAIDLRLDLRKRSWSWETMSPSSHYLRQAETLARALDDQRRLGWALAY